MRHLGRFCDMVTERSDTGKSYPPLPIREISKENSPLQTINVQMKQMGRQLTQLIDHLQKLNHQIQIYHEEREVHRLSDSFKVATERRLVDYDVFNKKFKSTDIKQKIYRRRAFSKAINVILIFLLVIGTAAALFVAIVLFFHGPKII